MVLGRRRTPFSQPAAWLALAALLVVGGVVARGRGSSTGPEPPADDRPAAEVTGPGPVRAPAAGTTPAQPVPLALAPGHSALVTVAVANVWNAPGAARPIDAPSLGNPVDVAAWVGAMSVPDKLWLVDHLVTQALYGERVVVRELAGDWARVVVTDQPSSLDPDGYPGWMPVAQLQAGEPVATPMSAVVIRPWATLRDAADRTRPLLDLSYNTRLPVLMSGPGEVIVALPGPGRGVLAAADVDAAELGPRPTTAADIVAGARLFSGLPYLWAGTSSAGFDCSGFTAAVYGVHGIVLPRDANDQAGVGAPVDRSRLQPGDLLFFSSTGDQNGIHHVSMYVGNGMMIQAPATGRTVETVPVDTPGYAKEFWGARRYLPVGAA